MTGTGAAAPTPGQAAYEVLVANASYFSRVLSDAPKYDALPDLARKIIDAAIADAVAVPSFTDDPRKVLARLRVMLATLTDRAEASGAITEDEAAEYRKDAGDDFPPPLTAAEAAQLAVAEFWQPKLDEARARHEQLRDGITGLLARVTRSADATRPSKKTSIEDELAAQLRQLLEQP